MEILEKNSNNPRHLLPPFLKDTEERIQKNNERLTDSNQGFG